MVGAFLRARAVIVDLATLESLPPNELVAGMAEIVKCGFIVDPEILDIIEADSAAAVDPTSPALAELVRRAITSRPTSWRPTSRNRICAKSSTTATLSRTRSRSGRTSSWRHGAAVSIGLVFAAELGRATGRLDDATADRHREVLHLLGLPTTYDPDALGDLVKIMGSDKKTRSGILRFVVLDGLARPGRLAGPDPSLWRRRIR